MPTIGQYLVQRLADAGLRHVFGIPGDYVLRFYDLLVESPIKIVNTCTELGAGFSADAYARVNGLGAVCVTYCVGGFNALNAVAGAFAEKSPLILISGAPGLGERAQSTLLHHKVRDYDTQREIFEQVTVATAALEDASTAAEQIDGVIAACLHHKRPVYIELPRDMVDVPIIPPRRARAAYPPSDRRALAESLREASLMFRRAKHPVILAGVEIHRYGLQKALVALVDRSGFPVAATLLSKSVISEQHPQYIGVYEGAIGRESVRRAVEDSDCLLMLGAFMTDIDLGGRVAKLDLSRSINATADRLSIRHHHFENVLLRDFIAGLMRVGLGRKRKKPRRPPLPAPFRPRPSKPITVRRFFDRINGFLDKDTVVICDIGDSLFGAADLTIHRSTEFISPAYYTSMGFAVPAAVGAQIGNRRLRPVVFVGDGAFQMTGQELSTVARYGLNPIVFVLNNRGYTTERFIHDGPYNDVHVWAYHLMPQLLREGWGAEVRTEGELETVLGRARKNTASFSVINVHLEPFDHSRALGRIAASLGRAVRASRGR